MRADQRANRALLPWTAYVPRVASEELPTDAARGEIPSDLLSDAQVVERLPVMFQAMREMDPAKLDQFIDLVRRS